MSRLQLPRFVSRAFATVAVLLLVLGSLTWFYQPTVLTFRSDLHRRAHMLTVNGDEAAIRAGYAAALEQLHVDGVLHARVNPFAGVHEAAHDAYQLVTIALQLIAATGRVPPCPEHDVTLPNSTHGRYLLAANLVNNEHVGANFVLQVLKVRRGHG